MAPAGAGRAPIDWEAPLKRTPFAWILPAWGMIVCGAGAASNVPAADARVDAARLAGDDGTIVEGKIGEKLDDYLSRLEAYGFNGAVLYAKKDRIYLRKAYGYASREDGRKNTLDTLFDIASVSKQFTAAAILKLQMQGKLRTEDPITKFFPTLGADKEGILLYHLLTHTSGLGHDIPVSPRTQDRDELIEAVRDTPTEFDPGETFIYNNVNFCLLGAVIEVVTGKRFEAFMREEIFEPAGMKSVYILGESIPPDVQVARAHRGDWEMWPADQGWFSWALRAAAGTLCSVNDLYRWELALRDERVLDKEAKLELFNRFVPTYTYGWFVRDYPEEKRTVFYHDGNTIGFQAHYARCPKDGSVVIILINDADRIKPVSNGVTGLIEGYGASMPPKPVPVEPEQLAKLEREYAMEGAGPIRLTAQDGVLVLKSYGVEAVKWRLGERSEADAKRAPRYDKRADEAMQAWYVGDSDEIVSLFGDEGEARAHGMLSEWHALAEAGGGLKGVEVLGTIPRTLQEVHTFVALKMRDHTDVIKLRWYDGELKGWDRTYPGVMRFVPVGDNEFVSYEITAELTPRDRAMKFVLDEAGNPEKVAILIDLQRQFGTPKK